MIRDSVKPENDLGPLEVSLVSGNDPIGGYQDMDLREIVDPWAS